MIARISSRIVKALIENSIIETEENEVYQYGIEMVISTTIVILIVLCCGILFGELLSSIVFFIVFAFVRSSSGGYHAVMCYTERAVDKHPKIW